jgi:hypothetical protein
MKTVKPKAIGILATVAAAGLLATGCVAHPKKSGNEYRQGYHVTPKSTTDSARASSGYEGGSGLGGSGYDPLITGDTLFPPTGIPGESGIGGSGIPENDSLNPFPLRPDFKRPDPFSGPDKALDSAGKNEFNERG